jgi:hypothetical protein
MQVFQVFQVFQMFQVAVCKCLKGFKSDVASVPRQGLESNDLCRDWKATIYAGIGKQRLMQGLGSNDKQ